MQHVGHPCPDHQRAVSCTGADDALELVGYCDYGHTITIASPLVLPRSPLGSGYASHLAGPDTVSAAAIVPSVAPAPVDAFDPTPAPVEETGVFSEPEKQFDSEGTLIDPFASGNPLRG